MNLTLSAAAAPKRATTVKIKAFSMLPGDQRSSCSRGCSLFLSGSQKDWGQHIRVDVEHFLPTPNYTGSSKWGERTFFVGVGAAWKHCQLLSRLRQNTSNFFRQNSAVLFLASRKKHLAHCSFRLLQQTNVTKTMRATLDP